MLWIQRSASAVCSGLVLLWCFLSSKVVLKPAYNHEADFISCCIVMALIHDDFVRCKIWLSTFGSSSRDNLYSCCKSSMMLSWSRSLRNGHHVFHDLMPFFQRKRGIVVREADLQGSSALHLCALCGHPELTELLCKLGADPSRKNKHGSRPLHLVSQCSSSNCVCISNKVSDFPSNACWEAR